MEATKIKKETKKLTRKTRQRYLKYLYRHNEHDTKLCIDNKCITCAKTYVANLSGCILTEPQILLLSKGLSFIPTARDANNFELLTDFNKFCIKIRHFVKSTPTKFHNNLFKKKFPLKRIKKLCPRQAFFSSAKLEGVLEEMKIKISEISTTDNIPKNLSPSERKALRELKSNTDLVINKADKGSTIVVQNRADYTKNAFEHLNDPITYRELDGDPTESICFGINKFLSTLLRNGLLNKEMVDSCSPPEKARLARLYFLKKIHKNPMGIRPIVSSCESPTENISQFLDYWLQPAMKALPSFLKDTTQLINELNDLTVEPDTLLATIDVKSLYTCIPHEEGIQACAESLEILSENNPDQPDTKTLINLLEIVLKNNTFEFDGKCFIQLQGTAMGTKLAPAYANIFMGKLEQTILSSAPLKPSYYKRYIDDILILWPHPEKELNKFISSLNSFHPSIKFTSEFNSQKITFLDINIYKGPNFLHTKKLDIETYIKPTNRQAYIHANSFHPPGTSKGVAIGETKRYLRTNSRVESFLTFKDKHKTNLLKRGYSHSFIKKHTDNIRFIDRSFELKPKNRSKRMKRLAFTTRFTPAAAKAMRIIKHFWPSLEQFTNINLPKPLLVYKSNKNIKSHLVRAKLPSLDPETVQIAKITLPLNLH